MKKIEIFYLKDCPHCKRLFSFLEELKEDNSSITSLDIHTIDEEVEEKYAAEHDYYYVPTIYIDGVKKHEGVMESKEKLERILIEE